MKSILKLILLVLFFFYVTNSCTITKRKHLKGVHIQSTSWMKKGYNGLENNKTELNKKALSSDLINEQNEQQEPKLNKVDVSLQTKIQLDSSGAFYNRKVNQQLRDLRLNSTKTDNRKNVESSDTSREQNNKIVEKNEEEETFWFFKIPKNQILKFILFILCFAIISYLTIYTVTAFFGVPYVVFLLIAIFTGTPMSPFWQNLIIYGATILSPIAISFLLFDVLLVDYYNVRYFEDRLVLKWILILLVAAALYYPVFLFITNFVVGF